MSRPRRLSSHANEEPPLDPSARMTRPSAITGPSRLALCLAYCLAACLIGGAAAPQVLLLPPVEAPATFRVGALELEYATAHPDLPPLTRFLPLRVRLRAGEHGWTAPRSGEAGEAVVLGDPTRPPVVLEASGLVRVLSALVEKLHGEGLYGVDVRPADRDIDLETERDLRPPDRDALALVVRVGRIAQVRSIAIGDRVRGDWKIDNAMHATIREQSPLKPIGEGDEAATDLIDRRALQDYLHRLNRHPGRRVEAALSPGEAAGEAVLDYRVMEAKPWYVFGQVTDTGTRRTNPWQTRLGFTHRQLTGRDDILSLEYLNAGFDDVNGVSARYQAPWFRADRPAWLTRRRGDPEWLDWLPREKIPWWGVDRLRWELEFGWNQSEAGRSATRVGLANDKIVSRQFQYGGRFVYEVYQHRDFFLDVWGGLRLRDVEVENEISDGVGNALLVLPRIGIHGERIRQVSTLGVDFFVEGQSNSIDDSNRDALGRDGTDSRYALLDFNLGYSTYLEPVFNPAAWRDPSTELSSTLAHEISFGVRGQYSFDYRLIPQSSGVLGGLYSVRGYSQSVAVGDSIVIGSLEYRFHLPRALPVAREPLRIPFVGDFRVAPQQVYGRPDWDLTLRAFVDVGRTIRNDKGSVQAGVFESNQTLIGAGLGAELQIRSNFRARIDWATALNETIGNVANGADVGDSEIHVLFSILY